MTTKRFLIILTVLAVLLALPNVASAQRLPPHVFVGTVTLDGAMAPDGTTVTAMVGGVDAGSTMVSGGHYSILVDQGDQAFAGEEVSFQIGGFDAVETAMWMQGGGDELNLSASSVMPGDVVTVDLLALNNSRQTGTATLTEMDDMTQVVLSLSAGASKSQLVHIHAGRCGDLGAVVYPLTSFVDGSGSSITMVDATLAMIADGNHAINAHDASDPGTFTSCGNIRGGDGMIMTPEGPGMPGERGPEGSAGPDGRDGAKGETGAAGRDGGDGTAGAKGDTGADGRDGAKGDTGPAGSAGPAGPTGSAGAAGSDGSSGGALGIVGLILAIIALVGVVGVGATILSSRRT